MTVIDMEKLAREYADDRRAVRRCAVEHGISIQAVYYHMNRNGIKRRSGRDATVGTQARENNPNWKGGTTVRKDGYVLEYVAGRQVFQHRLVAERMIGRALLETECVHHINGCKSDNRPENLQVMQTHAEHMKEHCDPRTMSERGKLGCAIRWGTAALKAQLSTRTNEQDDARNLSGVSSE